MVFLKLVSVVISEGIMVIIVDICVLIFDDVIEFGVLEVIRIEVEMGIYEFVVLGLM